MKTSIRALRHLLSEGLGYTLSGDNLEKFSNQKELAVDFIMCQFNIDKNAAKSHVDKYWVFDTITHAGQDYLIARDTLTHDSFAFSSKMGGWYNRLNRNDSDDCKQVNANESLSENHVRNIPEFAVRESIRNYINELRKHVVSHIQISAKSHDSLREATQLMEDVLSELTEEINAVTDKYLWDLIQKI